MILSEANAESDSRRADANASGTIAASANEKLPSSVGPAAEGAKTGVAAHQCHAIIEQCGASPIAPSTTECRQIMSGMTETGRDWTMACMKKHCFDRGLVGCEAQQALVK